MQTNVGRQREFRVRIPDNVGPGQEFRVMCGGRLVRVVVPDGAATGQYLQISVPNNAAPSPSPPPVNPSSPRDRQQQAYISVRVPTGVQPGQQFRATIEGRDLMVTCPADTGAGDHVRIILPQSEAHFEVIVPCGLRAEQTFMVDVNGEHIALKVPKGVQVSAGQKLRFKMPKHMFAESRQKHHTPQLVYCNNQWRRRVQPDGLLSWTCSNPAQNDTPAFARFLFTPMQTLDFHSASDVTLTSSFRISSRRNLVSHSDLLRVHRQDFVSKCSWFNARCKELRVEWSEGHMRLNIRRDMVLEDSLAAINSMSAYDLRKIWKINFIGEDGLDAGGLSRELFELVSKTLLDPDMGLWQPSPNNPEEMEINPASGVYVDSHLELFRFFGKILGKALFDGQLVSGRFSPYMLKHLLGWPISLCDLQYLDSTYHNSLSQLLQLDQDGQDLSSLFLNFTVTLSAAGSSTTEELIPDGANVELTNEKLESYLEESLKHRVFTRIRPQLKELLLGFVEVIPEQLLVVFDVNELSLLLCGPTSIDLQDWMQNTKYEGDYALKKHDHPTCRWFWEIISNFDEKEKRRFLLFATGSSGVPGRGFEFLPGSDGSIHKFTLTSTDMSAHPKSHTCFNRIDLPVYESKDNLQEALLESMANSKEFTMD